MPFRDIPEEDRMLVRRLHKQGRPVGSIARQMGMARQTVDAILNPPVKIGRYGDSKYKKCKRRWCEACEAWVNTIPCVACVVRAAKRDRRFARGDGPPLVEDLSGEDWARLISIEKGLPADEPVPEEPIEGEGND